MSFDSELRIDLMSLDTEWVNQPVLFKKYSDLWAQAKSEVDSLKNQVDRKFAEIFVRVKEHPENYTSAKLTEEMTKSLVLTNEGYIKLQAKLIKATEDMNMLFSAKAAFEQRKTALEHLTKLFLSNYWAEVRVPNEEREGYTNYQSKKHDEEFSERTKERLRKVRRSKKPKED